MGLVATLLDQQQKAVLITAYAQQPRSVGTLYFFFLPFLSHITNLIYYPYEHFFSNILNHKKREKQSENWRSKRKILVLTAAIFLWETTIPCLKNQRFYSVFQVSKFGKQWDNISFSKHKHPSTSKNLKLTFKHLCMCRTYNVYRNITVVIKHFPSWNGLKEVLQLDIMEEFRADQCSC